MTPGSPSRPRILLVDSYDSFTYNLVHAFEELGARVRVSDHDTVPASTSSLEGFDALVLSPGPGRPEEAGEIVGLVRLAAGELPVLGVCLGHQAIACAFGGRIVRAPSLVHGKTSAILHDGRALFEGLPLPFDATRYHSLTVDPSSVPDVLEVSARTADGVIMGLRHRRLPVEGVQFHPESVLTPEGKRLLGNFLRIVARARRSLVNPAPGPKAERFPSPDRRLGTDASE